MDPNKQFYEICPFSIFKKLASMRKVDSWKPGMHIIEVFEAAKEMLVEFEGKIYNYYKLDFKKFLIFINNIEMIHCLIERKKKIRIINF